MITMTDRAAETVRARCRSTVADPAVRIRAVHAGSPAPIDITTDDVERRPGDLAISSQGVVVLVDRELASPFDDHVLTALPDEQGTTSLYLSAAGA
jgi:Fe-S cluster assembly iron-binding protein IscA